MTVNNCRQLYTQPSTMRKTCKSAINTRKTNGLIYNHTIFGKRYDRYVQMILSYANETEVTGQIINCVFCAEKCYKIIDV